MRLRKDVLLWGLNEETARRTMYVAELRLQVRIYRVERWEEFYAALRLDIAPFFAVVLMGCTEAEIQRTRRDCMLPIVVHNPKLPVAEFLDQLRTAISRSRGPKKKPAASVMAVSSALDRRRG